MTTWITCGRCPNKWTGLLAAHCSACHLTFTSPTAFHKHRHEFTCKSPADVGLVGHERGTDEYKYVAWGGPSDDDAVKRFAQYRQERAEAKAVEVTPPSSGDQIDSYIETGDWLERERPIRKE